jgi:hypothetical protein
MIHSKAQLVGQSLFVILWFLIRLTGEKMDWQVDGRLRTKSPKYYLKNNQKMEIFQSPFLVFKINSKFDLIN